MVFKKSLILGLAISIVALMGFMAFEGQLVKAATDSFDVTLAVEGEISLNCPSATVALSPNISGMTGGTATASLNCGVSTNNASGYNLAIHATGSPAMIKDGDGTKTFDDANTTPFYNWSGTVATDESKFGFAVSSSDAMQAFKNNGSACNQGGGTASITNCFRGFNNTTDINIANGTTDTGVTPATTTIGFEAEVGATKNQATGNYRTTVIVTATTNG